MFATLEKRNLVKFDRVFQGSEPPLVSTSNCGVENQTASRQPALSTCLRIFPHCSRTSACEYTSTRRGGLLAFRVHVAAGWYSGSLKSDMLCVRTAAGDERIHAVDGSLIRSSPIESKRIVGAPRCEKRLNGTDPEGFVALRRIAGRESAAVFHHENRVDDKLVADGRAEQ